LELLVKRQPQNKTNTSTIKGVLDDVKAILTDDIKPLSQLIANGNLKIGKDTFIFNITPAFECVADKLGLCALSDKCYAKKAETQYWFRTGLYRRNQRKYWDNVSANKFADDLLELLHNNRKVKFIRFNESGDFKHQADITKLINIVKRVNKYSSRRIIFYTYTARKDLYFGTVRKMQNLVINGSNFMLDNNFIPVIEYPVKTNKNTVICRGNCRVCNYCKNNNNLNILIKIH